MFLELKAWGAENELAGSRMGTELRNRRNKVVWSKGREKTEHRKRSIFQIIAKSCTSFDSAVQ